MENVMKKTVELYNVCVEENLRLGALAKTLSKTLEDQKKIAEDQKAKNESLTEREKVVVKIEDIASINAENKTLLKQVSEQSEKLATEKVTHNKVVQENANKNIAENDMIKKEWAILKKAQEEFKKKEAKLEEDRKNIKADMVKDLQSKI